MDKSIFSKIYSYRELPNKHSKENFLTEIFAFCLEADSIFFANFLNLINIPFESDRSVETQVIYEQGRPDIELTLNFSQTNILIECKVESYEGENQLNDYIDILKTKKIASKRHLVYLTKYYDAKNIVDKDVCFHPLKWQDIYSLIDESQLQITQQLKQYLKDENMDKVEDFNYLDLVSTLTFSSTIRKMDAVLDEVKPYFEKHIGKYSREAARSTNIKNCFYSSYHDFFNRSSSFVYSISVGFYWGVGDITIAVSVYVPKKNIELCPLIAILDYNWYKTDDGKIIQYWKSEPLSQFIVDGPGQVTSMVNFLKAGIDELVKHDLNPLLLN